MIHHMTNRDKLLEKGIVVAFAVAGAFAWSFGTATAGRMLNTIDAKLELRDAGRAVVVTGPIGCPEGEIVDIHVKVGQESGATGTGRFSALCTGDADTWLAIVDAWGPAFEAGEATAHAWATTKTGDEITRSWDWSKDVALANP